ncbi:MAG: relaxase/mobilization nuclease domain-containing protein [Lachnospiraceae bacterium]|nr:relaxase/mobilization nuclease domain-containing protein [Lachnospiraceae bacterium]
MYTMMKRVVYGKATLNYILKESAHDGSDKRNQYVTGVNLVEGVSYFKQFQYFWDKAEDYHETQVRHVIVSFSDRELDPTNQAHIKWAHEKGVEYIQEAFPNRQVLVGTQTDGAGGFIHIHFAVSDCDMIDSAGFTEEQRTFGYLKRTCNKFFQEKGLKIDYGRNKDVQTYTQFERIFEEKVAEYNKKKAELTEQLEAATAAQDAAKIEAINAKIGKLKEPYNYKMHLTQRIQEAKEAATDYADFVTKLEEKGVIYDDSGKHNKFQLTEDEYHRFCDKDFPKKGVCRGKTLNEELFTREALQTYFDSLEKQNEDANVMSMVDTISDEQEQEEVEDVIVEPVAETKEETWRDASYMDAILDYPDDYEGDLEDEELAAAGYADDNEDGELSDEEEEAVLQRMRAVVLQAQMTGEAILEREDEREDEDDFLPT